MYDIAPAASRLIVRHDPIVRVTHWINALALTLLLGSGLQIFNAHPALYWGDRSDRAHPLLALQGITTPAGPQGITRVLGHRIDTTGVLGASRDERGRWVARGFPAWATVPGPQWLAMGRRWHFFFAWVLVLNAMVYFSYSFARSHIAHDIVPTHRDWRALGRSLWDHLRLRWEHGARYNPIQKLSYTVVLFVLGPLIVLTGLSMSPAIDAGYGLSDFFGGRQAARTIHFIVAFSLLGFAAIHIVMVVLTGPFNNLRGMITGRYRVQEASGHES